MIDFTLKIYSQLLESFLTHSYQYQTLKDYFLKPKKKVVILRHDVDRLPFNSLKTAKIEHEFEINGTYYFRVIPVSYDESVVERIAKLGHEIGYHYENLSEISKKKIVRSMKKAVGSKKEIVSSKREEELYKAAIDDFRINLEKFRKLYPVKTICMHGSPLSKYDNRKLWDKYDYKDFGIIGEPYFDIDFDEVLYLTDTGRRWDGVSLRDKVRSSKYKVKSKKYEEDSNEFKIQSAMPDSRQAKCKIKTTRDIIKAAEEGRLPDKIMLTIHPQRWTDNPVLWAKELVWQNAKNLVKRIVARKRQ